MPKKTTSSNDILCYNVDISQSKAKRHYLAWRKKQNPQIPERCDNPECIFYAKALIWNDKPLKLILDHFEGNNSDNRPHKLRLLCPNCNSQLETNGGGNKGKIEKSKGGFAKIRPDGKKDYILPIQAGSFIIKSSKAKMKIKK